MFRRSNVMWSAVGSLLLLCLTLGLLPAQLAAQDDPIPLPTVGFSTSDGEAVVPTAEPGDDENGAGFGSSTEDITSAVEPVVVVNDDFETGLLNWIGSRELRTIQTEEGNAAAQLAADDSLTLSNHVPLTEFEATVWFNLAAGETDSGTPTTSTLNVLFGNNYHLTLGAQGTAFGSIGAEAPFTSEDTALTAGQWHRLDLSMRAGVVTVAVNEAEVLHYEPASDGVSFAVMTPFTLQSTDGSLLLDDVLIVDYRPAQIVVLPQTSTDGSASSLAFDSSKVAGELNNLIQAFNTDGPEQVQSLSSAYALPLDKQGRISVEIWGAEGVSGETLANMMLAYNGKVETVDFQRIVVRIDLASIAALSLADEISVVRLVPRLTASGDSMEVSSAFSSAEALPLNVSADLQSDFQAGSRNPIGSTFTNGYDITGVQSWHAAGFRGNNVRVALIDVGFGAPANTPNADTACAANAQLNLAFGTRVAGDPVRGLNMLEVICDIAPASQVRLYKAQSMDQLNDALVAASADGNRVYVIGLDFGPNVSPGDGTLGYGSTKNPYITMQSLRNAGHVVLAAAGNSRQAYTAFNFTGTATSITLTVRPGSAVNIGWNDWDTSPNGGAPREDFAANISGAGFATITKPGRGASQPGHQFVVPNTCTANGSGFCTVTLNLGGLSGNASVVQVQVGNGTVGAMVGSSPFDNFGTITRPGDSPNALTVGGVCASAQLNYPLMGYSSRGPIYTAGGGVNVAPVPAYYTGAQVKPDLVAPAQVSTTFSIVSNPDSCAQGFGGTQAGLAHVAGQVAVMMSSTTTPSFSSANAYESIARYLRSHSFDQPATVSMLGYDMLYGAGVPVLGAANFVQDALPAPASLPLPNRIPPGLCVTGTVYVGPYNVGAANMTGSITQPYNSLAQAISVASGMGANSCVIALPGEYSSNIYLAGLPNKVNVFGYSGVVNTVTQPSRLHLQNGFTKDVGGFNHTGGIFVDGTTVGWNYFTFTKGAFFANAQLPEPSALVVNAGTNVTFGGNVLNGLTSSQEYVLIDILNGSKGVAINSNSFVNNIPGFTMNGQTPQYFGTMHLIVVEGSGAAAAGQRVTIANNNFRGNKNPNGLWILDNLPVDQGQDTKQMQWVSLVRSVDSYTDLVSNTFTGNESEALIAGVTRVKNGPQQTRILGNAIVNNMTNSYDGITSGPLIHYFFSPNVMIVNNTIARNNLLQSGQFGMLIGRGDEIPGNYFESVNNNQSGSVGSNLARWEFHNNFVVDNVFDEVDPATGEILNTMSSAIRVLDDLEGPGTGCTNFAGEADKGAFNNWLSRAASTPGACSLAVFNSNGNLNINPYPRNNQYVPIPGAVTYMLGGAPAARFTPAYYALSGSSNNTKPDGVDGGLDAFVVTHLPEFASGVDARGVNRRNNGDTTPGIAIDIGAYEFTPLALVNRIDITVNEDTGVISVPLDASRLSGGFPPYTVNILRYPKYFGVAGVDGALCDARFTAAAKGVVTGALPDGTPVLLYCPPKDFHTSVTDPTFLLTNAGFDFRVVDSGNRSANSTMQYVINPVNDAPLATVLGNNAPAGDIVDAPVAIGRPAAQNFFRLRPYVDFTNGFFFSERNNTLEPSARNQVDYMFTYGTPTLIPNAPGNDDPQIIANNLVLLNAARGIWGVNLANVPSIPGGYAQAKFQYKVTDRNGNSVNNIVTVRALTPPSGFNLVFPGNNAVFLSAGEVNTFRWSEASNSQNYRFILSKISGGPEQVLLNLPNLTPPPGDDNLSCSGGTCTLTLTAAQKAVLNTGQFKWQVVANNQGLTTNATNAPFFFNIATGTQLVQNGSFEQQGDNKKIAAAWKPKNTDNDKRLCNKPEKGKFFSHSGECAYRFKGKDGIKSAIVQKISQFGKAGDRLAFSFFAKGEGLTNGASAMIKVKYVDGTKAKEVIDIPQGDTPYTPYSHTVDLTNVAKNAKIKFTMNGGKGKYYIDTVSGLFFSR